MLPHRSIVFLLLGAVAMLLGVSEIALMPMNLAWIILIIGLVLAIIFFALERRPRF